MCNQQDGNGATAAHSQSGSLSAPGKNETQQDCKEIAALYAEIGNYERHFNTIQGVYRGLASSWLLAAFGAIGLILTNDKLPSAWPAELLVAYISLLASIGLLALWNLDVNVYHRLLVACFEAGEKFEEGNAALPKIREKMRAAGKEVCTGIFAFYLAAVFTLLLIAANFTYQLMTLDPLELCLPFLLWVIVLIACVAVFGYTRETSKKFPRTNAS